MKKFPSFLLLAGALIFPAVLSAASFEGKVTMTMSSPKGETQPITFSLKDGMQRIDATGKNGTGGAIIMNMPKLEMTILMEEQKKYWVRPINPPQPEDRPQQEKTSSRSDVSFEKTSTTENILGYTCEKYVAKSKDGSADIWVTDQLGAFMGMGAGANPMGGRRGSSSQPAQAWEKAMMGKNFFPMRVVGFDKNGKENSRMEVTAIDKHPLPASLFAPPADYTKFEMPNIGDMMKGMIPGR